MCLLWSRLHPVFLAGSVSSAEALFSLCQHTFLCVLKEQNQEEIVNEATPPSISGFLMLMLGTKQKVVYLPSCFLL